MSRMTEEEEALDKLEQLGKLDHAFNFVSNDSLKLLAVKMQEYIDDAPVESDNFLTGLDVTQAAAVELFNDFLLFLNEGTDPPVRIKDPSINPLNGEEDLDGDAVGRMMGSNE